MAGIATFSNNPKANTGISISGSLGQSGYNPYQQAVTGNPNNQTTSGNIVQGNQKYLGDNINVGYANSGSSGASVYDPSAAAVYQGQIDQAQRQLDSYDGLQGQLIDNVNNAYNGGLKSLNDSNAIATRNYNINRTGTIQDNVTAKSNIDSQVRSNTNALQRLLGLAGSGNSSAADYANYAAARQGTQQRQQVQDSYGKNLQSIDTAYGDSQNQYQNGLRSLEDQKTAQTNNVISGVNQNRTSLLNTLANLRTAQAQSQGQTALQAQQAANPYTQQIQSINDQAAGLAKNYANPVLSTAGVAYAAPSLASYATDDGAIQQNAGAVGDTVSPLYYNLLNKDKNGALIA